MKKKNCTKTCTGIIKEIRVKGLEFPTLIIVKYEVDGNSYEIKEQLVFKPTKVVKLLFIPIGHYTKSLIEIKTGVKAEVGNKINVRYNPDNPSEAYLPDNDSKITWA